MAETALEILQTAPSMNAVTISFTVLLLALLLLCREPIASTLSRLRRVCFAMRWGRAEISGTGEFDPNPSLRSYRKPSRSRTIEQIVEHREKRMRGTADSP